MAAIAQCQKVLVLTGGTSGFGRRMVERTLASHPEWRIVVLARPSQPQHDLAAWARTTSVEQRLQFVACDLASLASVDAACTDVIDRLGDQCIDTLTLNAGVQAILGDQASQDGLELSFALNHLAHFLICERLASRVRKGGRIVLTASEVHDPSAFCMMGITRAQWQDPHLLADPVRAQEQLTERVDRGEARYCASKLLNIMHVRHMAQTLPHVSAIAFNPSVVPATNIARERNFLQIFGWTYVLPLLAPILPGVRSIEQSAGDLRWLSITADADRLNGCYVDGREVQPGSDESRDQQKIDRVIAVSRELLRAKLAVAPPPLAVRHVA